MAEDVIEQNNDVGSDNSKIYISSLNKYIDVNDEVPITPTTNAMIDSIEIVKLTIEKLYEQIDFLKEELRERNILIKILNFRNANEGAY